jgi:hypothetical protein
MPYRTMDNRIDGVVITFADITAAKIVESGLREENTDLTTRSAKQEIALDQAEGRLKVHDAQDKLRKAKRTAIRKAAGDTGEALP